MLNLKGLALSAILLPLAFSALAAPAPKLQLADLPQSVRAAAERELAGVQRYTITKATDEGKPVHQLVYRDREKKEITVLFDEKGSVVKRFLEDTYYLHHGRLERDGRPTWIQTVQTPTAGDPGQPPETLLKAIYSISDVGGTPLVFDLYGFNTDGTELSKKSTDHVRGVIKTLVATSMGGILRVLGPDAPKDAAGRQAAVRAAAGAFAKSAELVYWIDGPDVAALAAEFKRLAPGVVVIAPGADVEPVDTAGKTVPGKPVALIGGTPDPNAKQSHFILPGRPEDFGILELLKAMPIEKQPWKPDNSPLSPEEREEGFVALFDGKTLNGWTAIGRAKDGWAVRNGELHWVKSGSEALQSRNRYGDFVLRFDYKIMNNGNSGVQVRCPRANRASKIGFEVQIFGDYGKPPTPNGTGAIYDVIAPTENASKPAGEWNSVEVTCQGPRVRVVLNGKTVNDVNFDEHAALKHRLRRGFIRITDHGNYAAYRKIRIKEL